MQLDIMADYSSILRRKEPAVSSDSNTDEDLLVFGYSCKLFRDDEKALFIDQGKHLIPWMGDEALKIDRYDGRGALSDLKAHEAQPGMSADECLTEAERKVELLCNEERYRALHCNEDEEALYQGNYIFVFTIHSLYCNFLFLPLYSKYIQTVTSHTSGK